MICCHDIVLFVFCFVPLRKKKVYKRKIVFLSDNNIFFIGYVNSFYSMVQCNSSIFCPSVCLSVNISFRVKYIKVSLSAPVIAKVMEPYIVFVLDILLEHAPRHDSVPLTNISHLIDFDKILRRVK